MAAESRSTTGSHLHPASLPSPPRGLFVVEHALVDDGDQRQRLAGCCLEALLHDIKALGLVSVEPGIRTDLARMGIAGSIAELSSECEAIGIEILLRIPFAGHHCHSCPHARRNFLIHTLASLTRSTRHLTIFEFKLHRTTIEWQRAMLSRLHCRDRPNQF